MRSAIRMVVAILVALAAKRLALHWYGVPSSSAGWLFDLAAWSLAFVASYLVILLIDRTVVVPIMQRARG